MPKKDLTEIVVVLDRSGSMVPIRKDMEGGFDSFIDEQRKLPGSCSVTLVQFDSEYELVYQGKPLADVPRLVLEPRGATALLEAIYKTIDSTGERLRLLPDEERPERVLFVVITDGEENASNEFYSRARVLEMVKRQTEVYSWQFVFFGSDQDAIAVARNMGIHVATNFAANSRGTAQAMNSLNVGTSNYRGGHGYGGN